jgi:hypothetical protein
LLTVQLIDEGIHDSNRVVLCDEVIQAFRQQCDLLPVLTFDESGHIDLAVQYVCGLYRLDNKAARGFSHGLQRLLSARAAQRFHAIGHKAAVGHGESCWPE